MEAEQLLQEARQEVTTFESICVSVKNAAIM